LKNSDIVIKVNYEDEKIQISSFKNEFSQALLNILSNAKDILIQRDIKNPFIKIDIFSKKDKLYITIEDNAKGIEKDIIKKIFDPYFTTKHKSQGTGIGLYMTKMIIENNINGSITVKNSKIGAFFTIQV
jgi:signal transduction histidine kinase